MRKSGNMFANSKHSLNKLIQLQSMNSEINEHDFMPSQV